MSVHQPGMSGATGASVRRLVEREAERAFVSAKEMDTLIIIAMESQINPKVKIYWPTCSCNA